MNLWVVVQEKKVRCRCAVGHRRWQLRVREDIGGASLPGSDQALIRLAGALGETQKSQRVRVWVAVADRETVVSCVISGCIQVLYVRRGAQGMNGRRRGIGRRISSKRARKEEQEEGTGKVMKEGRGKEELGS